MNVRQARLLFVSFLSTIALVAHATILPKNDLHLEDNVTRFANITEQQFNNIVNKIVDAYKPIVKKFHNADLVSNNLWSDPTVNASAVQYGDSWQINMYGGLARRDEVTPDGFALVVCHELGHHLGGFPFYGNFDWAATEGQSDYFATQACAKYIWKDDHAQNAKSRSLVSPFVKSKCDTSYSTTEDQNLCYRASLAGHSLASLLAALNRRAEPKFETPDPKQVLNTVAEHPEAQCRLDTYFNGGLCKVAFDENIIPGKSHPEGQESQAAEALAANQSCHAANGILEAQRPRCWFKPTVDFKGVQLEELTIVNQNNETNPNVIRPGDSLVFNYSLDNGLSSTTPNVVGNLSSSNVNVQVKTGTVNFGDIAPGEIRTGSFRVDVSKNTSCGSGAALTLTANTSQNLNFFPGTASVAFTKNITVGRFSNFPVGENNTSINIPDKNSEGITSSIHSSDSHAVAYANVTLHISHTYPRDLSVSLVSPAGKAQEFDLGNVTAGEIRGTYKVQLPTNNAQGEWKLKVVDHAAEDAGTLNGWSLSFSRPVCD